MCFSSEDNFSNCESLTLENRSQLAVHASFWFLGSVASDTFVVDPLSMMLEPGQKQVDLSPDSITPTL